MAMKHAIHQEEKDNDWAKNVEGVERHISQVQSGRKGYTCIGCGKDMEAVKKRNQKHRSFFRHVAIDVSKGEEPCAFSSRNYRETLVKDILQRIKRIKLPALYKYPPKGIEGFPQFLRPAQFVSAVTVRSEITFYEDDNGQILSGKNPEIKERYLHIRPDIIFYNEKDEPILFIELVVTNKVSEEKKITLKRMGIDTVQFIVPRKSEQEIENSLKTTANIKWIYNEIEANTTYSPFSSSDPEGVSYIDEQQKKLFEESYKCRATQIGNLVRSIKRNLESQQYIRTQRNFESEISRIAKATREAEQRLEQMERTAKEEAYSEFAGEFKDIEEQIATAGGETAACEELLASPISETELTTGYYQRRKRSSRS